MIFAPHISQVKILTPEERDEFGRPIPNTGSEEWRTLCHCRCDDNSTKEFKTENGDVYRPLYHIVCDNHIEVKAGDEIRVVEKKGCICIGINNNGAISILPYVVKVKDTIKCLGKVYMVKHTNFFNYTELWI